MDTIFAVSSGRPPAAIAVIRMSGPRALAVARDLAGTLPTPRRATLRPLRGADGELLDTALVLTFPGTATATGEDVVELHCHGGRAVIDAVERELGSRPGLRAAEPGEFTRRALMNGRIDLAQAEGLADLLTAETEAQRRLAVAAAEGVVSQAIRGWLDRLAALSAEVEATLDFAGDDDVATIGRDMSAIMIDIERLRREIDEVLSAPPVERVRDGIRVVIAGPPNSGKSTLLNRMAQREAAIVTPISGTTRDLIDVPITRGGIAYLLTDTAGLIQSDDVVERIGVGRALEAMEQADVLLWLGDEPPPHSALWIHARADLPGRQEIPPRRVVSIGFGDDAGLRQLWSLLSDIAVTLMPLPDVLSLRRSQRRAASAASASLFLIDDDALVAAECIRVAMQQLGTILGIDATEMMLDSLFGQFCLGK